MIRAQRSGKERELTFPPPIHDLLPVPFPTPSSPLAQHPPRASSSTSGTPSASKKRKTAQEEPNSDAPSPPPSPSTSYFFADGNVLLHVKSTLFKVHRGVLEKAEVFADTLFVSSGEGGEGGGGIPTIKLEDTVEDWELFLRAMYDGL